MELAAVGLLSLFYLILVYEVLSRGLNNILFSSLTEQESLLNVQNYMPVLGRDGLEQNDVCGGSVFQILTNVELKSSCAL